jgi:hypothetical protein
MRPMVLAPRGPPRRRPCGCPHLLAGPPPRRTGQDLRDSAHGFLPPPQAGVRNRLQTFANAAETRIYVGSAPVRLAPPAPVTGQIKGGDPNRQAWARTSARSG